MIKQVSTKGMTREQWLDIRRKSIGGSDAAAIVGLNPYSSPFSVWADKRGMLPPVEDNEAMRIGRDLEDYVAHRFCEATGKKVSRKNAIIYNTDYPFAHANVDRLIVGERAGLECKTTSVLNLKKFQDGDYPANYYVQCQHYMMVTGYKKWYLAVLILGKEFLWFEIPRNDDDINALYAAEKRLWQCVIEQVAPPTDGSESCTDALNAIYNECNDFDTVDLTPLERTLKERSEIAMRIADLEKMKAEKDNEIKNYLGKCEYGECDGFKVSWKPMIRNTFDTKKFKSEMQGADLSSYYKSTKVRVFKIMKED